MAADSHSLPKPGSSDASDAIDSVLGEYNWPANPKNAARAGFEAARRMLSSQEASINSHKFDSTRSAVVNPKSHWLPIDKNTPRGCKVYVIRRPAGVATTGVVASDETFWTHWHPIPTFNPEEEYASQPPRS
ncbi:hypothetical protein FDI24_gp165 [Acidovorax phage ACP17]|uniref:Uncharacterized protein n=1 Tax=Acidovorax phage ACP17 TaxID=2010329 RepID=A0A223AIZ8_9CAUD|nr:hypothetical protein FDI24_gp165 [Acidovorax phage ACP17]ASS33942.1 hypothetical protein [Acidovorax phage ACP17]